MRFRTAAALFLLFLSVPSLTFAAAPSDFDSLKSQGTLTLSPSSVTIKVGDTAPVNVTIFVTGDTQPSQVCFSVEGFPSSGFVTTFEPECSSVQASLAVTVLMVEATPAAAPQSFNASVIGKFDSDVAQSNLQVTVVPAIPAWIPWSLVLAFVAFFVATLVWPLKRRAKKT